MSVKFIEGDPPGPHGKGNAGKGINFGIAAKLRSRPGTWAHIRTFETGQKAANYALLIRTGRASAFSPANSFDAVSRTVEGEYRVYAVFGGGRE